MKFVTCIKPVSTILGCISWPKTLLLKFYYLHHKTQLRDLIVLVSCDMGSCKMAKRFLDAQQVFLYLSSNKVGFNSGAGNYLFY